MIEFFIQQEVSPVWLASVLSLFYRDYPAAIAVTVEQRLNYRTVPEYAAVQCNLLPFSGDFALFAQMVRYKPPLMPRLQEADFAFFADILHTSVLLCRMPVMVNREIKASGRVYYPGGHVQKVEFIIRLKGTGMHIGISRFYDMTPVKVR
ncbi:MAG: hypothetical protein AAFV33_02660 [Chloroflexota bacterium]